MARSFDGVKPDATWPWYGKREQTSVIKQQLVKKEADAAQGPSLESLRLHAVHLPPMPVGPLGQTVFNIDMQRDGGQLLVSSETMLAMYSATNPTKPVWSQTRRLYRRYTSGAMHVLPCFDGRQIITHWGGDSVGDYEMLALRRTDGTIVSDGDAYDPHTRVIYRLIGRPVVADNKVFSVQSDKYDDVALVALSCFEVRGMAHRWTRKYDAAGIIGAGTAIGMPLMSIAARPSVNKGSVYFCSNAGRVVRADIRDGQMEWIHFFRPANGDRHQKNPAASPWCLGAAPVVTEDKVICMPNTGRLFVLDKSTGRRVWATPLLRGHQVLGMHQGAVLVIAANSLYAIDVGTGKLR